MIISTFNLAILLSVFGVVVFAYHSSYSVNLGGGSTIFEADNYVYAEASDDLCYDMNTGADDRYKFRLYDMTTNEPACEWRTVQPMALILHFFTVVIRVIINCTIKLGMITVMIITISQDIMVQAITN